MHGSSARQILLNVEKYVVSEAEIASMQIRRPPTGKGGNKKEIMNAEKKGCSVSESDPAEKEINMGTSSMGNGIVISRSCYNKATQTVHPLNSTYTTGSEPREDTWSISAETLDRAIRSNSITLQQLRASRRLSYALRKPSCTAADVNILTTPTVHTFRGSLGIDQVTLQNGEILPAYYPLICLDPCEEAINTIPPDASGG